MCVCVFLCVFVCVGACVCVCVSVIVLNGVREYGLGFAFQIDLK